MYFPQSEYERRRAAVEGAMGDRGLETAIVWGRGAGTHERCGNLLYLTNYYSCQPAHEEDSPNWQGTGFSAVILRIGAPPVLVVDMPDPQDISVDDVIWDADVVAATARCLSDAGVSGRVGLVGSDFLPMKYFAALDTATPGIAFEWADDLLAKVRRAKSDLELDCIRLGGRKLTEAFELMADVAVRGGCSQADVAAVGVGEIARRGGSAKAAVSSGTSIDRWTGDPLTGASTDVMLEPGDMVRLWLYGPVFQGYWFDPGRTFVVGASPTAAQRRAIECGTSIVDELTAAIRPGVAVADVVRLGMELRQRSGTDDNDQATKAWPLFGHGIGLFWEGPSLVDTGGTDKDVFQLNDTLGVEVFLHWPELGSVGFENNVIVGADRCELLTPIQSH